MGGGYQTGTITQDWEPITIRKSKPKSSDLKNPKTVNNALRTGVPIETVKKNNAGTNKSNSGTGMPVIHARKLDETTEPDKFERVSVEIRSLIQKARIEKKMSQSELAKLINERVNVVQEYENGKAVPNNGVLMKMEKVLGVKLRGKK